MDCPDTGPGRRGRFEEDTEASVGLGGHGRQPRSPLSHPMPLGLVKYGGGGPRMWACHQGVAARRLLDP